MTSSMNQHATAFQKTRAEQETENEANRLIEQVETALVAIAVRPPNDDDSLQLAAERIERIARDLADALRALSRQRKDSADES
jgi:molecular chaperone DnaK (HSP70)